MNSQRMIPILLVCLLCTPFFSQAIDRVIYGIDNRQDLYEVQDSDWLQKARSTVALIQRKKLSKLKNGTFKVKTAIYGEYRKLCRTEPFYEQERAAFCSGSLIGDDLVLTAGHCVRTANDCKATSLAFDFAYKKKNGQPSILASNNVYNCKRLIVSKYTSRGADFAIIQLDRTVMDRLPLSLREKGYVKNTDEVVVIGHPSGLPTKFTDGGKIRNNSKSTHFVTNLDTYGGNSGSGVFNADTGKIEGILVRGTQDFVKKNGCYVSNICAEKGCRGEDVTRINEVFPYL